MALLPGCKYKILMTLDEAHKHYTDWCRHMTELYPVLKDYGVQSFGVFVQHLEKQGYKIY